MDYSKVETTFQAHIENKKLAGIVYGVYQSEKEVVRGVLGYQDCAQILPLREDAIFRLASMTKPITAVAVLIAEERGLLSLEDTVSKYICGFQHNGVGILTNDEIKFVESAREITIHDCLTHTSGLGSGEVGNYQFLRLFEPKTLEEKARAWNKAYLDFSPKTKQAYSGLVAFDLLAYIVQLVSGMSFEDFLRKEIFTPLGMSDTVYRLTDEQKTRLVEMVTTGKNGGLETVNYGWRGFGVFAEGYTGGSAGLFSTLSDYSKFVRMLACNGEFQGTRILSTQSVKKMRTAQLSTSLVGLSEFFNWGLGVRVCEKQGENQPLPNGSFGWSGAYGTHFWVEPSTCRSAILMLNKADVGGSGSPFSYEFEKLVNT